MRQRKGFHREVQAEGHGAPPEPGRMRRCRLRWPKGRSPVSRTLSKYDSYGPQWRSALARW